MATKLPPDSPWFAYGKMRPAADCRLLCFPYAGGAASVFCAWPDQISEADVWPVQLPGRERRLGESLLRDVHSVVESLWQAYAEFAAEKKTVLFGHSLGALIAFEFARKLQKAGVEPVALVVAAYRAPGLPLRLEPIHDLPTDAFWTRLRELGGISAELLEYRDLMELTEPILRADFEMHERHELQPSPRLTCPITVVGGNDDEHVPVDDLRGWAEHTTGPFELRLVPGGHFFLKEDAGRAALLDLIRAELSSDGARKPQDLPGPTR